MGFDKVRKTTGFVNNDTKNVEVEVGDRPDEMARGDRQRSAIVSKLVNGDPERGIAGLIEQGGPAERNFVSFIQVAGKKANPQEIQLIRDVLSELPTARAAELLQMGGSPEALTSAMSGADASMGQVDPGAESALESEDGMTARQKQSLLDKQEYALTRKDKSKPVREYDSSTFENAHPLDRNGTYDPKYAKFMRDSWESRAKGAGRYEGRAFGELPGYAQKDIVFEVNKDLGKKIYGFQDDALRKLNIDESVLRRLTPEQIGILSGVAPDQLTPEVLQRLYGMPLTDEVIRGMQMNTRNSLVGRPDLAPSEWEALAGFDVDKMASEFDMFRRGQSSAQQKLTTLLRASKDAGSVVNPAQFITPWRGQFQVVNPLTGLLESSPNAPSGRFLSGQIATAARSGEPGLIDQITPLMDRSVQAFASQPPAEAGFRNAGNMSEAAWSRHRMQPGGRGFKILTQYASERPYPMFSETPIRRAGDAPATLGNIEIDTTPQVETPADMPITTEQDAPVPMDNDLGMYGLPPAMQRMNPSVLSALLA